MLLSCNLCGKLFWNFLTHYFNDLKQDPTVEFYKSLYAICTRIDSFGVFFYKT
jgi:hypothetical protein